MSKTYLRGDLYYADLGHGIGSEQKAPGPLLSFRTTWATNIVPRLSSPPSPARQRQSQVAHPLLPGRREWTGTASLVLLEQIRTVDKRRLSGYIGRLDEEHIRGINHALAISIGLIEPVPPKLTLCLCDACADAFRSTGAFVLREAAQGQLKRRFASTAVSILA